MRAAQYRIAQAKQLAALENPVYTALDVTGAPGPALQRSLTPALDPVRLAGLAAQNQFLLDWGYIRRDFNIDDWIDPTPLNEAKLFAGQATPVPAIYPPVHGAAYVH